MLEENNNWRKKFNTSSLENEDWLEPSDKLFAAIEEEIYEDKKKRRVVFPWLFLGLLMMSVAGYFTYSIFSNNDSTETTEQISSTESNSVGINETTNKKESTKEIVSTSKNNILSAEQAVTTSLTDNIELQQKNTNQNINDTKATASTPSTTTPVLPNSIFQPSGRSTKIYEATNAASSSSTSSSRSLATALQTQNTDRLSNAPLSSSPARNQLAFLAFLNSRPFQPLGQQGLTLNAASENILKGMNDRIDLVDLAQVSAEPDRMLRSAFYLTGGLSKTEFKLNQNFASAVDPADFSESSDSGMSFGIGYKKGLTEKLGFVVELDYSKAFFMSGHNSSYNYITQNASQEVNLTMATPLGFMEGSVLLLRTAAVTDPEVDLVLDLHNEHRYSTAGMNIGLAYELVSFGKVAVGVEAGLGVQKLFGLSNTLIEVNTSDANFLATQTNILSDQSTVREWLPRSLLGISLQRALCRNSSIGLSYKYISGLQPIHSEGDLSTRMYEQRLQLCMLQNF